VEPSDVDEAFGHTVRVAFLAPIDYNSVKYKSKLPELCCCDASYDSRIYWDGFVVTPSKCDGDGGTLVVKINRLNCVEPLKSEYFLT